MKKSEQTFAQRAIRSLQDSRNSLTEADVLKSSRTNTTCKAVKQDTQAGADAPVLSCRNSSSFDEFCDRIRVGIKEKDIKKEERNV